MGEIGFGEPWFFRWIWNSTTTSELYDSEHEAVYASDESRVFANIEDDEYANRIVACVNALAGLNPAALGELIAACDELEAARDSGASVRLYDASRVVEEALAKLRGTGGGE